MPPPSDGSPEQSTAPGSSHRPAQSTSAHHSSGAASPDDPLKSSLLLDTRSVTPTERLPGGQNWPHEEIHHEAGALPAGAIAGIVLGALVFCTVMAGGVFFLIFHRGEHSTNGADLRNWDTDMDLDRTFGFPKEGLESEASVFAEIVGIPNGTGTNDVQWSYVCE
jgi:hypothetical protein